MSKPFFTIFLEEQDVRQVKGGIASDDRISVITDARKDNFETTMKYPSDGDEGAELELL